MRDLRGLDEKLEEWRALDASAPSGIQRRAKPEKNEMAAI
jgi:hypothetical protein